MNPADARGRRAITVIELQRGCPLYRFDAWLGDGAVDVVRPYMGDAIPSSLGSGLIVLGGHASPYDDASAPWLPAVRDALAASVATALPVLGICLGAQLLAVACGGRVDVAASPGLEAGVVDITWRTGAASDPLVAGFPNPSPVVSMHADAVSLLPPDAEWLASSDMYPYQAFRLGSKAWGVQFHPEVSPAGFAKWADEHPHVDAARVLAEFRSRGHDIAVTGRLIAQRFAGICRTDDGDRSQR